MRLGLSLGFAFTACIIILRRTGPSTEACAAVLLHKAPSRAERYQKHLDIEQNHTIVTCHQSP
jgi:hypothetical protein